MMIQVFSKSEEEFLNSIKNGMREIIEEAQIKSNSKRDDYLTRQETADLLKINLSTLSIWTKKGKLTSYGIQGRVYYRREDIDSAMIRLN